MGSTIFIYICGADLGLFLRKNESVTLFYSKACPALQNPVDGSVSTPDGTEFQNEAVYSCSPGFELNGDRRRCCGSTGSWSGDAPSCVQIGRSFLKKAK